MRFYLWWSTSPRRRKHERFHSSPELFYMGATGVDGRHIRGDGRPPNGAWRSPGSLSTHKLIDYIRRRSWLDFMYIRKQKKSQCFMQLCIDACRVVYNCLLLISFVIVWFMCLKQWKYKVVSKMKYVFFLGYLYQSYTI